MSKRLTLAACAAVAGLAAPAMAQDSVSNLPGSMIGDALVPWETSNQCAPYAVDLVPFTTSGGTTFGIAPLIKSSKAATAFFSSLVSAQSVSATEIVVDNFANDYFFWDFAGGGVNFFDNGNGVPNLVGQILTPTAEGEIRQFTAMFGEFATTDAGTSYNAVVGGVVQYDKANPKRLYVTRVLGATTGADNTQNNGAIGVGTADAAGNLYVRADSNGATGPSNILGNNIVRVSLLGRNCDVVNALGAAGAADAMATEFVVNNSAVTHSVPGNLPADITGRPIYAGMNFSGQYAAETAPLTVTNTSAHNLGTDQRGNIATYKADLLNNNGVASAATLSKSGPSATDSVDIFSLDANGALIAGSAALFTLPAAPITDGFDGHTLSSNGEYDHYHSQVPFNGGNAQVALGRDAQGRTLFAGVSYLAGAGNQDPLNAIIVGRFDPASPANVEYTLGGFTDAGMGPNGTVGKPVYDDMGNVIGQMRPYFELDPLIFGPAMSGVAFDGAGNIWFTALVDFPDEMGVPFLKTTLLRGVYQPDVNGSFGYRLEKVLAFGDIFDGANSGRQYRLNGFEIVDNNSVSSGTFWSTNVKQCTWGNIPASELDSPADPRSTAGVVVSASITYDVDQDSDFTLNTMTDPNTIDEGYNVLLYVSNIQKTAAPPCPADLDGSGDVGGADLAILLAAWGGTGPADLDNSGAVGGADLAILLAAWGPCPM